MIVTFILGVTGAIGNHFFYLSLADSEALNQKQAIETGTAIAFLTKALFAACVGVCHRQRRLFSGC